MDLAGAKNFRAVGGYPYQVADNAVVTLVKALAAGLFNGSDNLGQSIGYPFMVDFVGADHAFGDLLRAIAANGSGALVHAQQRPPRQPEGGRAELAARGLRRGEPPLRLDGLLRPPGPGLDDATIAALRARLLV